MAKIALVPIDNRPVCYDLPKMTVNLAKEHTLFLPDISLLGSLTKNADVENILDWLSGLESADIIILSLDTIAYGGLIPSRRSNDSTELIKERINRLCGILKEKNARVFAFSSIMRISNNNINEEEKEYWSLYGKKIFEYSYNFHKTGKIPKHDIPEYILDDYLQTRNRNFEINKYYLELKKQGYFDTLVFSKDDCSEYGLNIKEALFLKEQSNLTEGVFVKTGADEIPLTLLSAAINKKKKIKTAVVYTNPDSINKISKYEDINVKESVESQILLAGGLISDIDNCDMVLLVNNFENEQGELVMNVEEPLYKGDLNLPEKPYFIADILNANGSDNNFVEKLMNSELKEFYGYAGWNTTGNTLGSVISAALTYYNAENPDENAFNRLQMIRFLDDWAYQANVRSKIRNDKNNLSSEILKDNMKLYENIVFDKFKSKRDIKYKFPWNRFFEIDIMFCE